MFTAGNALRIVERLLLTAVSIVLVLIVGVAFTRAIRGGEEGVAAPAPTTPPQVATTAPDVAPSTAPPVTAPTTTVPTTTTFPPPESECVLDGPDGDEATIVQVYFTCGARSQPGGDTFVYRTIDEEDDPFSETLVKLTIGPTSEEIALGFRSIFSPEAGGRLEDVTLDAGSALVDFATLADPSSLAPDNGAQFFIVNLNANVFQYPEVDTVEYRLGGSCDAFWEHLGIDDDGCRVVTRSDFEAQLPGGSPG